MAKSGTNLGLVGLSSDIPHWYSYLVARSGTRLGLLYLSSDIPPGRGI